MRRPRAVNVVGCALIGVLLVLVTDVFTSSRRPSGRDAPRGQTISALSRRRL